MTALQRQRQQQRPVGTGSARGRMRACSPPAPAALLLLLLLACAGQPAQARRESPVPCYAPPTSKRICFAHVPKTGGSTLMHSLFELLDPVLAPVGHFCNCMQRTEPLRVMLLRDPLKRLWSSYFHQKQVWRHAGCQAAWANASAVLDGCYQGNSSSGGSSSSRAGSSSSGGSSSAGGSSNSSSAAAGAGGCSRQQWASLEHVKPCSCCGLPTDLTWVVSLDPPRHGPLVLRVLQAMAARSPRERQLAFLDNPGVHNIAAQLVLSNETQAACFADVASPACRAGMAADLAQYCLVGFTEHHAAFSGALIDLACRVGGNSSSSSSSSSSGGGGASGGVAGSSSSSSGGASGGMAGSSRHSSGVGVGAPGCVLGGRNVSAASLLGRDGSRYAAASARRCCWLNAKWTCGAPECRAHSKDEAIHPEAMRRARSLNALDLQLYRLAREMADGRKVVYTPPPPPPVP